MEETLVSFEVAKLLKERGFKLNRNYFGYIDKFYEPITQSIRAFDMHGGTPIEHLIYIPTQSLAQKWLREVHNIHITIFSSSQESWMYRITKPHEQLKDGLYGEDYYTYEEALEAALQEALKLI